VLVRTRSRELEVGGPSWALARASSYWATLSPGLGKRVLIRAFHPGDRRPRAASPVNELRESEGIVTLVTCDEPGSGATVAVAEAQVIRAAV